MKKNASFSILHRIFGAGAFVILGGLFGFLAYLYFAFNGILSGEVKIEVTPDLLANLQYKRFEDSVARMKRRRNLPDIPADMPDPFDAPKK
ncbi:MAG: hypothetical protein AAB554_04125 [Patescibacteria group bacterium]